MANDGPANEGLDNEDRGRIAIVDLADAFVQAR
jgi:hypothetical protein